MVSARGVGKNIASLPVRGAWVEIGISLSTLYATQSRRSPCGERGLKLSCRVYSLHRVSVAPRAGSVG